MNSMVGQEIDLFGDAPAAKKWLKRNIDSIVAGLSKQFANPEDCLRELVQNAVDADSPQVNITYAHSQLDETNAKLEVTVEDFGTGMTHKHRDDFFLTLFRSSKEDDDSKIGKYGIGISSVFALGLDEFITESCGLNPKTKEHESWRLHIKDISSEPCYAFSDGNQRKGTKITLVRTVNKDNLETHIAKVQERVAYFCERLSVPIYVQGVMINKPFDIDTRMKVSGTGNGFEFVMGVGNAGGPIYELSNHRLLLERGTYYFWEFERDDDFDLGDSKVAVLVSSSGFRHTPARDKVIRGKYFDSVGMELQQQFPNLFLKCLETIDYYINNPTQPINYSQKPKLVLEDGGTSHIRWVVTDVETIAWARQILQGTVAEQKSGGLRFKGNPQKLLQELDTLENALVEHATEVRKQEIELRQEPMDLAASWDFINFFFKYLAANYSSDSKKTGVVQKIKNVFGEAQLLDYLRANIPAPAAKYPIIKTVSKGYVSGYVSIPMLLDTLHRHKRILYMEFGDSDLIDIIAQKGEIAVLNLGGYHSWATGIHRGQEELIRFLTTEMGGNNENDDKMWVNAHRVYTTGSNYRDSVTVDEPAQRFLEMVRERLPKKVLLQMNDMYYTTIKASGREAPVFLMSTSGSLENVAKVPHYKKIVRRLTSEAQVTDEGSDIILNLDHPVIQQCISLSASGDATAQSSAISAVLYLIRQRHNNFYNRRFSVRYFENLPSNDTHRMWRF